MTWGLGSNVLPIILLSVKFMIVLLLEKIEKRIYDYRVAEISLQNFSAKTFKSSVWKKMVTYVPLKIFFVNKLSTHPGKYIMVIYHLEKRSRKILLKSKWKTTFWVLVPAENFREQRNIWKGSPVFSDGILQTEIRVPFLQTIFDTSFRPSRSFSNKWNWLVQMVNAISGRNIPVLNFAYHLPKPWSDRFAHRK